jgi:RimJ/RimL family protein N-acetyltransferase
MRPEISLRPVEKRDYRDIFRWRNEKKVREGSFSTKKIFWAEHVKFWNELLRDKNRYAFIVEVENKGCGVVRLNKRGDDEAEVDILISTPYQSMGVGSAAIRAVKGKARGSGINKLVARVKPGNEPSVRMFEKNDFKLKYHHYECKINNNGKT